MIRLENPSTLDSLSNISITSALDNQLLQYDAAAALWKNESNIVIPGTLIVNGNSRLGDATTDYHGINIAPIATRMLTMSFTQAADVTDGVGLYLDLAHSGGSSGGDVISYGYYVDHDVSGNYLGTDDAFHTSIVIDLDDTSLLDSVNTSHTIGGIEGNIYWNGSISDLNSLFVKGIDFTARGNLGTAGSTGHTAGILTVSGTADTNIALDLTSSGATTNYSLRATGDLWMDTDNDKIYLGAARDAYIEFDGDSLNIVANDVTATDDLTWIAHNTLLTAGGRASFHQIDAPPVTESYRRVSYLPVVTADNIETPYTFERAAAPLTTPTSDASGDCLHPDVLYIPNGWNGYTYWMVMTPFLGGDTSVENPEILASNDGETWTDPGTNPIAGPPGVSFYSDPCLMFYQNTLYCYWTWNDGTNSHILLKTSTDGVNWSGETTVLTTVTATETLISPIVRNVYGTFYLWTLDNVASPTEVNRRSCATPDGTFASSTGCTLTNNTGEEMWHIHHIWDGDAFYGIWKAVNYLYFVRSYDGLNWDINGVEVYAGTTGEWDAGPYQTAIIRRHDRTYFDVFYSAISGGALHRIGRGKLHWPAGDDVGKLYGYRSTSLSGNVTIIGNQVIDNTLGAVNQIISRTDLTTAAQDPRFGFYAGATPAIKALFGYDISADTFNITTGTSLNNIVGVSIDGTGDVTLGQDAVTFGAGLAANVTLTFDTSTNDGVVSWVRTLDFFQFADDVEMYSTENIYFRDTAISINSATDGHLDLTADVSIDLNANTINLGTGAAANIALNWDSSGSDGAITWVGGSDYFQVADDLFMYSAENIYFRATGISINSAAVGHLDLTATTSIDLNGITLATNKVAFTQVDFNEYIDSLADGFMDYGATTAHRFLNDVKLTGDSRKLHRGTDDDVSDYWDGSDWLFDMTTADVDGAFAIKLHDNAGASSFEILDSTGTGVLAVNSVGTLFANGFRIRRFTDDVSNPPTDAELDAAIGAPSVVGTGYIAMVDDNDAGANVYLVGSTGTDADKWQYITFTVCP